MTRTFGQEILMKRLHILLGTAALLTGCSTPGLPPYTSLPPIVEEYYECSKCESLHGGIYGKGPTESFKARGAEDCYHSWSKIERSEFQQLAAQRFPSEWSNAIDYVKRP